MRFTAHTLRLVILIALALVGTAITSVWPSDAGDVSGHPWIGKAAPPFDLAKVGGGSLALEGLKGKYVVIHFGASW